MHLLTRHADSFALITARARHRLPDALADLWKDQVVERVEIAPLDRDTADQLVAAALDARPDAGVLDEIWRLSMGNPMYIRELVRAARETGALRQVGGVYRWVRPVRTAPRLVELIEGRMGELSADDHALLRMLAFGEPLGLRLLERSGYAGLLPDLEARSLVTSSASPHGGADRSGNDDTDDGADDVADDVELRLAHPLYAEVLRGGTSPARTPGVYAALARAAGEARGATGPGALRVAGWRLHARLPINSSELLARARDAGAAEDWTLSERFARAARRDGGWDADLAVAQALLGRGKHAEAEGILAGLPASAPTPEARIDVALARAVNLYSGLALPAEAAELLRSVRAQITDDTEDGDPERSSALARVATVQAGVELHSGSAVRALEVLEPALTEPGVGASALLWGLITASMALCRVGRYAEGRAAARRGLDLEREKPESVSLWSHTPLMVGLRLGEAWAGGIVGVEADCRREHERVTRGHWLLDTVAVAIVWAESLRLRGRPRTALDLTGRASEVLRTADPTAFYRMAPPGVAAGAAALLGDAAAARRALEEIEESLTGAAGVFGPWLALARAWHAQTRGEVDRAVDLAWRAAELSLDRGQRHFEIAALHEVVRLGRADLVADRLAALTADTQGELDPLYGRHARAQAELDGAGLDLVASGFAAIGADLLAAEAAADATHAHAATGNEARAAVSAMRSRAWLENCEGARTLALTLPAGVIAVQLTRREREIAWLAAGGASSAEICRRLVLSVRTVDNTLQSVYRKLGLAGRRELPDALGVRPVAR
ncbi:MAG TPA: LuxR C-terminal-related transcriptional regulator [Pseudonocardia sp.]